MVFLKRILPIVFPIKTILQSRVDPNDCNNIKLEKSHRKLLGHYLYISNYILFKYRTIRC